MSYDNVKLLLKDRNGKYLVGKRLDSLIPYSAFGGQRESGETLPITTLNRELKEESADVLFLHKDKNNKLYLILSGTKDYYPFEIKSYASIQLNKQVYIVMKVDDDLSKYITFMNEQFLQNQSEYIQQEIKLLTGSLGENISAIQIYELVFRFKNNYSSPFLKLTLQNLNFSEKNIKSIIQILQNYGYRLEMDGIALVDKKELEKGLYEKSFFLVEDQKFQEFFKN